MSDAQKTIEQASARILAAQKEREDREKSANAHESAARDDRLKMSELKQEIAALNAVLRHAQVQKTVEDAATSARNALAAAEQSKADAEKSKADADATLARLAEKEKQVDELLAKGAEATAALAASAAAVQQQSE